MYPERHQTIFTLLKRLHGLDPLKELFWSELNYQRINKTLSRRGWTEAASKALVDEPLLFAAGGTDQGFHVIYSRLASDRLQLGLERPVVARLLRDHPYALFIFSNRQQDRWHFLNVKYDEEVKRRRLFRRITIGLEERLRTASERIALLDLEPVGGDLFGISALAIQERHDTAFDVEAVTKQFFEEYKAVFDILQRDLAKQAEDNSWAHDFALQFLNRSMFLYFIQRKGWLGEDRDFLCTFWDNYRKGGQPADSFTDKWLKILFFEAFNNKFHGGHRQFPDEIKKILSMAPYLNGGLFRENELDKRYDAHILDKRFEQVFKFLERYNFTITEDSPLDQEVAVDPEMIGKVYESLVNVSEETDERGDAGIFYTPRTEIDLMCRLTLTDHLANHLGPDKKDLLCQLLFSLEPEEKTSADKAIAETNLWPDLDKLLREITVLDPACGSGSFLVGMLHILDDLQDRADHHLRKKETTYDRRKRIIGQSLYGVDVMDWACHVTELRLWLALIIDAEFTPEDLHVRREPLLPHFSFKIRSGDSLVQEVGGVNLGHMREIHGIPASLKGRILALKKEKLKFYNNDPDCRFRSPDELLWEELRLFRDILDERDHQTREEIKKLRSNIEGPTAAQLSIDGTEEKHAHQLSIQAAAWEKQMEALSIKAERIEHSRAALKTVKGLPFVWDIAFVEIFEGEKEGFDIVIGNPPYVRQESIADPRLHRHDVTSENKKEYKTKLARSVYQAFPRFFGYKEKDGTTSRKLDAKSDLYIYFYFHGLSLMNSKGSFCFITSNSWLDVGYGKDLQEFLLRHDQVKLVLDNQARRSFASADVNTVIVLLSAPDDGLERASDKTARFVMFKVPFEHILSPVIFQEIEGAKDRLRTQEYNLFPILQRKLLEDGITLPEKGETTPHGKKTKQVEIKTNATNYIGNKWGGKYLRAPDIYWTILNKGKDHIQELGRYFAGERYLNTGGADGFFILDEVEEGPNGGYYVTNKSVEGGNHLPFEGVIEKHFLRPLIKNYTKKDKRIEIRGYDAYCLVIKDPLTAKLKKYIKWGEEQGYHLRSVTKNQHPWYRPTVQMLSGAKVLVPRSFSDAFVFYYNPKCYVSLRYYRLQVKQGDLKSLVAYLNSTLVALFFETLGNKNLGQGVLDFFMADFLSMKIPIILCPDILEPFNKIKDRRIQPVWNEYGVSNKMDGARKVLPHEDRMELDGIVFDALKLTKGEREAVYEKLIEMVDARMNKAASMNPKAKNKRLEAADLILGIWSDLPQGIDFEESEN